MVELVIWFVARLFSFVLVWIPTSLTCKWTTEKAPEPGAPTFVIIHGTWARRSRWAEADKPLQATLRNAWPGCGIVLFKWSGLNSLPHRLRASDELRGRLKTLTNVSDGPVVAIAHSHGGNVLAWASATLERPLAAVVYLNTPFILLDNALPAFWTNRFKSRWLKTPSKDWLAFLSHVAAVVFGLGTFVAVLIFGPPPTSLRFEWSKTALVFCITYLLLGAAMVWQTVVSARRLATVAQESGTGDSRLVMSTIGDEAAAAYGSLYLTLRFSRLVSDLSGRVALLLVFVVLPAVSAWFGVTHAFTTAQQTLAVPPWFEYLFGVIAARAVTSLVILALLDQCLGSLGHGFQQLLVLKLVPVVIALAPLGTTEVWTGRTSLGVKHGAPYQDSSSLTQLSTWLQKRLGNALP